MKRIRFNDRRRNGPRVLAVVLALSLLLQAAVVAACGAHDAVHAHAAMAFDVADLPAVDDGGNGATGDEGTPLHLVFHASHCGCTHAATAAITPSHVATLVHRTSPPAFDAGAFERVRISPLLRPPTAA